MVKAYAFISLLLTINFADAQSECEDCLKVEVVKNEYYDTYWKIPNSYIVDERGDTFDYNLLDLKLTFSTSKLNYMVYVGAFNVPSYYRGDNTIRGLGHITNLDSFTQNLPYTVVLVENQQGDIKLLGTELQKRYPAQSYDWYTNTTAFYQSFKIVGDSIFSIQIQGLNNSLKIRATDTMLRFHYLYRPSIGYLRDYFARWVHLTLYSSYADSARCSDCSNMHVISNWFELPSEQEVRIISKDTLDNRLIAARYRTGWPSKDNFQGNGLYELLYKRVRYTDDKKLVLPVELVGQEEISIGFMDSSERPLQLLIQHKGLVLYVNNAVSSDSNTGIIYSVLLDIEGKYTRKAYSDQLPLALNYSDQLSDIKKRYATSNVIEEGHYVHLFLDENVFGYFNGARITYDQELQRISEIELYFGDEDELRFWKELR